ncbi:MAG: DUF4262 domain-containing protein [Hyphomonas sp.]|nr:DUF4262 domain-containing protein [Hyphomonas sp.]
MVNRSYNHIERSIFENVGKHGWQSMSVFDPDGKLPGFTYSIGFATTLHAPEFIIFGLNRELMHNMLWEVFHQIRAGQIVSHGLHWKNIIGGFDCVSMHATHEDLFREYTTSARWYWQETGHTGVPEIYQLVWPGARDGLFPWDDGCDQGVIDLQPKLWA